MPAGRPTTYTPDISLGKLIESRRLLLGMNKKQFCETLGVTPDSLRHWERDNFTPSGKNMYALIDILHMTKDEVMVYFKGSYHGSAFNLHA